MKLPSLFRRRSKAAAAKTDLVPNICNWVIKICLYLLVFLMPIFFLPYTFEVLEFNRQNLLVLLTLIALIAWLGKIIATGRFEFRKNILNVPIFVFLVIYAFASYFSMSRYQSFIGSWSQEGFSFITVLSFVLLYFIIVNNLDSVKRLKNLLTAGLISSFLVGIHGLFQMFGKFILPVGLTKSKFFNLIGTFNVFAIFCGFVLTLVIAYLISLYAGKDGEYKKSKANLVLSLFLWLLGILMLLIIILIDFWAVWFGLIISMVLILVFAISRSSKLNTKWLMLPMIILVAAVLFQFINLPINLGLPAEVMPNYRSSWQITKGALQEKPLLGSGPGTFIIDYAKYKPQSINDTAFWNIRFDRAMSEAMTFLATTGLLGTVAWLLLVGVFIYLVISRFFKSKSDSDWLLGVGLFSAWALLFVAKFLYSSNITLSFFFWFVLALLTLWALKETEVKKTSLETSPKAALVLSFVFILVITVSASTLYLIGQRYAAEVYFKKGLQLNQEKPENFGEINNYLTKAVLLNKYQDSYYRSLANVYLSQIDRELQKLSESEENREQISRNIQVLIDAAINAGKRAAELNEKNVVNWSTLASVYQNITPLIRGADEWAVSSYQKAIELEPANPVLYTELAKLYITKYDFARQAAQAEEADTEALQNEAEESLQKASENLYKALEVKRNYSPAHFQLAMVHARKGDISNAISELEINRTANPRDVGVAFQLGLLYYQDGQKEKAIAELKRAINLAPNYSNARWYLASIYEEQGETEKAIEQIEKVVELNPDNELVQKKLEDLKFGQSTPPPPLPEPVEPEMEESSGQ